MAESIVYDFEWGPVKAYANLTKHGVSFEQAATVFLDPLAITIYDAEHSQAEERWITMGRDAEGALLVVVHTFQTRAASTPERGSSRRGKRQGLNATSMRNCRDRKRFSN